MWAALNTIDAKAVTLEAIDRKARWDAQELADFKAGNHEMLQIVSGKPAMCDN